jgi:nitroreductase
MESIYKRRSIRKYTSEPVQQEKLLEFIKAGMNAPSAGNQRPWQFVIITERKLLDEIPKFHPYSLMLHEASAAILVCGNLECEKHKGYWVQDCSAATQNILLEITDQGLGGVWLGVYPREDRVEGLRKLLNIPEQIIPFSLIAVGYPAEEKPPKNEFDHSRIKYNRWQ